MNSSCLPLRVEMRKKRSQTDELTQKTQPKKGEPIEIPVPEKSQIMGDFEKIATSTQPDEDDSNGETPG